MKKSIDRYIWAVVLISIGLLILANNLNLINYDVGELVFGLWPLFLIIPGVASLQKGNLFWGSALSIGGLSFLLANFTDIKIWQYIWPLLIISFGISLVFGSSSGPNVKKDVKSKEDYIDETAIFGGIEKRIKTDNFKGGKVDCVFGGAEIDLRKVKLSDKDARLEVNAVFGGGSVLVNPENYKVKSNGTGVFGAWVNESEPSDKDEPVLEITGTAIFGGVEIKS
jgi:predicted membrane protein